MLGIARRRRRIRVAAALLAVAAMWLSACTAGARHGGAANSDRAQTVIFDIASGRVEDPTLFNPFLPSSRVDQGTRQSMIEPLFLLNYQTNKIDPWLATSMTSTPGLDDWTMKLRSGIKWSDGQPFTADDVVFTISMLLDHAPDLVGSGALAQYVKTVDRVDDLTVHFALKQPDPRFQLDFFASKISANQAAYVVPKHIWQGKNPLTFKNYDPKAGWPVFTGPYTLQSASPTNFVYKLNPNWWGVKAGFMSLPKPKKLVWTAPGPESTRTAQTADDDLDSLMDISTGAYQALTARNRDIIAWRKDKPYMWPDPCERNLELNNDVAPWNDADMRWAVNFAIDRDQIVSTAYEGSSTPSKSIYPAYPALDKFVNLATSNGLYDKYPLMTHDVAKAKQIIESKGYKMSGGHYKKDGKTLSLDIEEDEPTIETQRVAQVMVEQLQAIGINASTRNVAEGTWIEDYSLGKFEAQVTSSTCGSVNEPWASLDTLNKKYVLPLGKRADWGFNGVRFSNDEYSKIVDQMGALPLGDPKIDGLFLQAWDIFLKELPVIPLTQARKIIPFDTRYWTGWPSTDNGYIQPPTWWQSTHVIIHHLQPAK